MTNYPKISIITPSYNQGQYIEQTILSVINQNYPNLEYIIIDGGSTDNTVEIIKKYEKYITYWVSEPDQGHSHAVNKGLKYCTGEIFNWLNSDDYYEKETLYSVVKLFAKAPKTQIVAGKERAFDSDTNKTVEIYNGTKITGDLAELIYQGIIDQPPTFWKINIINEIGYLPEKLHYTMDSYWWTLYLLKYGIENVVKTNKILTNFRLHKNSKTVSEQAKFEGNRFAIRLALAKHLNFDKTISDYFNTKTDIILYIKQQQNNNFKIKLKHLEANFAKHVYQRYYMMKNYKNARKLNKKALSYYHSPTILIDFCKLNCLPVSLLELFRKLKNS